MVFFKLTILSCLIAVIASASFDAKTTTTKAATTKATTTTTQGPSLLNVTVVEIGDTWARFQVIGDDNLYNYPVESVNVDYHIVSDSKVLNSKISPRSLLSQTSSQFKDNITLKGLEPGQVYSLKFSAINTKKQVGPPSHEVKVLLLPSTPSIVVAHPEPRKLVVKWNKSNSKREDYFILEVFKTSVPNTGFTLNITKSFGNSFTLDGLDQGEVYELTMKAHNPTGFSAPVVVKYPVD